MPSRTVIIAVVVFWLGVMAWLVKREIWPRLAPGEPPPFAIDHLDSTQHMPVPTRWKAEATRRSDGQPVLSATINTSILHQRGTDKLDLRTTIKPQNSAGNTKTLFPLERLHSLYHVDIHGRMLGLEATAEMRIDGTKTLSNHVTAEVREGLCDITWTTHNLTGSKESKVTIETPLNGLVMMPLHPVHRMEGLKPGKSWGVYLLDPLDRIGFASEPRLIWVSATVENDTESLTWHGKVRNCRIVSYRGGDVAGKIWVDPEQNHMVLKLLIDLGDKQWKIERE